MSLPYPDLPEVTEEQWRNLQDEDEDLLELPPDGWSIFFGCRECGHVKVYPDWHVAVGYRRREQSARFHNETSCFAVTLRCARADCKAPATLHVNMRTDETEKDLVRLLRTNFFDGLLPCGHQIMPIPEPLYRDVHRVMDRLW